MLTYWRRCWWQFTTQLFLSMIISSKAILLYQTIRIVQYQNFMWIFFVAFRSQWVWFMVNILMTPAIQVSSWGIGFSGNGANWFRSLLSIQPDVLLKECINRNASSQLVQRADMYGTRFFLESLVKRKLCVLFFQFFNAMVS